MHRQFLIDLLSRYQGIDQEEESMRQRMLSFIEEHENCFDRELSVGHITGSAWIVNPKRDKTLMLHHAKLNRWLQPGGHSDGDADTLNVALREASEESGVLIKDIRVAQQGIFDVDIHTIPANKKEAEHEHFDVRFLLEIDDEIAITSNEESHDVRWLSLDEVSSFNEDRSISRMLEKTKK